MRWLHGRTSGVFAAAGNAAVAALATPGMAVTLTDGTGWISNANADGIAWWIDTKMQTGTLLQLPIDMADATLDRIDRVIVEWQTTNYVALPEVKILKGALSSSPAAPALTNNGTLRQISLARVSVAAGVTAITASMITDERLDPAVCGLVTDGLSIDTDTINAQFSELLAKLQREIAGIEAGTEVALKTYVDDAVGTRLPASGGTMTGNIDLGGNALTNVKSPAADAAAATKGYVDERIVTYQNVSVPASAWASGGTIGGAMRPIYADVTLSNVTSNMYVSVVFKQDDIEAYNFASTCYVGDGFIEIYAETAPTVAITIPTIICLKA